MDSTVNHAHFYWYLHGKEVTFGRLKKESHGWNAHRIKLLEKDFQDELSIAIQQTSGPILLYFHGYMADFPPVNKEIFEALDAHILSSNTSTLCIHIQWQAYTYYPAVHTWMQNESMVFLSAFLKSIESSIGSRAIDLLAHSMGASLLHYALHSNPNIAIKIHKCVLAAPELSYDDFAHSSIWQKLKSKVMVFATEGDFTLTLATFLKKDLKLGLATDIVAQEDFQGAVVTDFSEEDLWIGKYLKHRYFYTNHKVRSAIRKFLYGE